VIYFDSLAIDRQEDLWRARASTAAPDPASVSWTIAASEYRAQGHSRCARIIRAHEIGGHGPRRRSFSAGCVGGGGIGVSSGGLSGRGFGHLALFGRLGQPGGAVARQSLLGETMLFALVLR
jgi:hypothetical protein